MAGLTVAKVIVFILSFIRMALAILMGAVGGYVIGERNLKPCQHTIEVAMYLMLIAGIFAFIVGLTGAYSILLGSLTYMAVHVGLLFLETLITSSAGAYGAFVLKVPFIRELMLFYLIPVLAVLDVIELCLSVYLCCQWPPYHEYLG